MRGGVYGCAQRKQLSFDWMDRIKSDLDKRRLTGETGIVRTRSRND